MELKILDLMIDSHSPKRNTATAGGMTKSPTSQSATARLITKQLVTVRRRRVVSTDKMTNVLPITVTTISTQNMETRKPWSREIGGRLVVGVDRVVVPFLLLPIRRLLLFIRFPLLVLLLLHSHSSEEEDEDVRVEMELLSNARGDL